MEKISIMKWYETQSSKGPESARNSTSGIGGALVSPRNVSLKHYHNKNNYG